MKKRFLHRRRNLSGAAVLLLLASACGNPESAEQTAPDEAAVQNGSLTDVRDACELLTGAEVEALVGASVQVQDLGRSPVENWSACGYLTEDGQDVYLETQVAWAGGQEKALEELDAAAATGRLVPIEGIADGAWFSTYTGQRSLLLKGDILAEFHTALLPGDDAGRRAAFEAIARHAAPRL